MKERILKILENERLTATRFADRIGVQRSSISHIISGRNKPSYDFILKTVSSFPNINAEWLINGKGSMYKDEKSIEGEIKVEPELFKNNEKREALGSDKSFVNTEDSVAAKDKKITEEFKVKDKVTNVTMIEKVLVLFSNGTFKEYYKLD
jgi:transcriptional regulator with XRE-family HTH domain